MAMKRDKMAMNPSQHGIRAAYRDVESCVTRVEGLRMMAQTNLQTARFQHRIAHQCYVQDLTSQNVRRLYWKRRAAENQAFADLETIKSLLDYGNALVDYCIVIDQFSSVRDMQDIGGQEEAISELLNAAKSDYNAASIQLEISSRLAAGIFANMTSSVNGDASDVYSSICVLRDKIKDIEGDLCLFPANLLS